MKKHIIIAAILSCKLVYADLPLSLEGLSPEAKRFKLGIAISYYNHNADIYRQSTQGYLTTPQNTLIEIPSKLQSGKQNTDMLYSNLSLQYGLTPDIEIYGNLGGFWQENRYTENNLSINHQQSALSNINLGINKVLLRDGNNPMLMGTLETALFDKVEGKNRYGKSWFVGVNAYKAHDPIVFSLTAGYRFHFGTVNQRKTGNYFLIKPAVSFAANDRVSLNAKLQWIGKQGDKVNGIRQNFATNTQASFGVGYAFSQQTAMNLDASWHLSGNEGSQITLSLQHRF